MLKIEGKYIDEWKNDGWNDVEEMYNKMYTKLKLKIKNHAH